MLRHGTSVSGCKKGAYRRLSRCAGSFLPRRLDRLISVLHEPLRAADGARDVVATVKIAEILRRFERFLERGLRKAQGGAEPFELTLIDFSRSHRPDANVRR